MEDQQTAINEATTLIRRGEYRKALTLLEALLAERNTLTRKEISDLCLRQAACLCYLGAHRKALLKAKVSVRLSEDAGDNSLRAHQKFILGEIYYRLGDLGEAIEVYNEAYVFYKTVKDYKGLVFALFGLGSTHTMRGDLRQAVEVFRSVIKHCATRGFDENYRRAHYNLYRAYLWMGRFADAEKTLNELNFPSDDYYGIARVQNLTGISKVFQLDLDGARKSLAAALRYYEEVQTQRDQVICLEYLGLAEFLAGNYEEAKRYYIDVLVRDELTGSARAQTLRLLTDVYVAEGNLPKARETAQQAEGAITRISERIELGALYRAQAQIYASEGKEGEALDCFSKSIMLLRELGARYELALTHLACGQSPVYTDTEQLDHLRHARTLFVEMEVPKRVAQVELTIAELQTAGFVRGQRSTAGRRQAQLPNRAAPVVIARSRAMREIVARLDLIKETDMTILLTGETGTGKDLLSEYIHATSQRADRPFVAINCAAIPELLLESELFGVRRGSFTGATRDKEGLIEGAEGGTVYFNEIGEIPASIQVKLLEILDTKLLRRLGENRVRRLDVRFVAATNQDLKKKLSTGEFREDLYFRLQKFPVHLPPLRERRDDIPHLARHFLQLYGVAASCLSQTDMKALISSLCNYSWPGNVRELQSVIGRAVALWNGNGPKGFVRHVRSLVYDSAAANMDRETIVEAMERNSGNKAGAARFLRVPVSTLRYHLRKLDLE